MSGKGLSKVIRGGECLFKHAPLVSSRRQRSFTNSPVCPRAGHVPSFLPTSSPELDDLLSKYRKNLFLPAHLSEYDQELVYGSRHAPALLSDPVKVHIGEEEFVLEHINRLTDLPHTTKGFRKVLNLMTDNKDWDNLPNLLEGLRDCKRPLTQPLYCQMIRKAGLMGRMDAIIESARRVRATGFSLQDEEVVQTVMYWIYHKAKNSGFEKKETKQALAWAEMVVDLLEDPKHAGHKDPFLDTDENDVRALPDVIGILLDLSAICAAKETNMKDVDGKVMTYTTRLLGTPYDLSAAELNLNRPEVRVYPSSKRVHSELVNEYKDNGEERSAEDLEKKTLRAKNHWLVAAAPVLHGMKIALKIFGPETKASSRLKASISQLESRVNRYASDLEGVSAGNLGLRTYIDLFGSESTKVD
ncbi:hypothetical protein SBOR_6220 [Sclerotinia borealis F-4128]|uniref:Uncharacterized protein n=1 Tax=Sclerotinia borealis (strain F-4128) TaxID=1432307 RepID=W9CFV2_SCLBF|nr:hypothetical protein SBOR_6220 [Sclerotinia borealis F-4128]